ncbi:hypothetical protein DAPPUDRAFT_303995 [Daphnia pulex]|uniref:Uncharacterized protein n=1 Tax=Daphnia pulex TaxID=6669 RepID=E9GIX4_DAPPU|nr:hypothetical protein DAPPUDRAFT_303995 [Daphnia pulex]|eukprot:EFX80340.1 hypothetical protein DAPPUDRAFT_303995 [Daphnia pulex]
MNCHLCYLTLLVFVLCLVHRSEAASEDGTRMKLNTALAKMESRDKRWVVQEVFDSTVNFIKWNFIGRISVSLINELMKVIDPVVYLLLPRGASTIASVILSFIYKKLQFFIMYWFNNLFFNL